MKKNASFRINAAQSFNGLGQFVGPIIGGADGKHGLEEYLATHVVYLQYNTNKQ